MTARRPQGVSLRRADNRNTRGSQGGEWYQKPFACGGGLARQTPLKTPASTPRKSNKSRCPLQLTAGRLDGHFQFANSPFLFGFLYRRITDQSSKIRQIQQ